MTGHISTESRHNTLRGVVEERHYDPLTPYHREELQLWIGVPHISTQKLRNYPARARQFLGSSAPNWPADAQRQGVSGGMSQDQCGLCDLNAAF